MTADELRAFLVQTLESLDDGPRGQVEDALLRQAARSAAGWRPAAPRAGLVDDVRQFLTAARRIGSADPGQIDDYLREGVKASLTDDSATAAALFAELLPAIGDGNIDLGQHELVDEVLSVDLTECAARYLLAVYAIAELKARPDALLAAIDKIDAVARLWEPIAKMEGVSAIPLPDLQAFLPLWVDKLRSVKPAARAWEDAHDRRLREAVTRDEGIPGLARLARTSRRPEAARAWCEAVRETGNWKEALRAYEEAAKIVSSPVWRGDFLDGAALAAERLGLQDRTERLEVAFRQAPSLVRMLRWLTSDEPTAEALRKRASSMLADEPPRSARLRGVLHLVAGDILSAAALLTKAPGLGWSQPEHPGHQLFGAFATLLGAALAPKLQPLDAPNPFDLDRSDAEIKGDSSEPRLPIPSFAEVLRRLFVASALIPADRTAMRDAMRAAAIARVDGVLGDKRRRQYEHAAALVACCAELDQRNGSYRAHLPEWVIALKQRNARFPAFQTALRTELGRRVGKA